MSEGVAATLEAGRGDGGTVFVQAGGSRNASDPPTVPQIVLAVEHYNRLVRILDKKIPVTLEFDVKNTFYDADLNAFNVVAEIPGTDKADELVMIGAHFDSWHGGTGATDNAAGSAVMMEAMRILKATGLRLRRTVRIGLWTGEESGLLGSRAYVDQQFATRATLDTKPAHAKFAGYFNVDNGTGAIRGVYLQGNEAMAPIFRAWMQPFENLRMTTLTIRNTGGTDHQSFDAVGLPGFQFIQDPVEYRLADAPLEHGRLRSRAGARHDAERGHRRGVRVSRGEPRTTAPAQTDAEAGAPAGHVTTGTLNDLELMAARELPLRISVLRPPEGVRFGVQRGKTNFDDPDLLAPARASGEEMAFDFTVRIGPRVTGQPPNLLGAFAQGPPSGRFVYLNAGKLAGQRDSCWERRAKIPLTGITWKQIDAVLAAPGALLEARIAGTGRDGSPVCASVPLIGGGWHVIRSEQ